MTINLSIPLSQVTPDLRPRITVIGVGGAGGNAVNNMIRAGLEGVEFLAANTDAQALAQSASERRIQLGTTVTQGLGAGSRPDIGRIAAEEAMEDIIDEIRGSNMVFIAAGMGGGTGTGAAPVIARAAREQGILTVGVVTKPFHFEGAHRMRIADEGIQELEQFVDTLIVIPNQNLFRVANDRTTFADAFKMADDVLYSGVRGVTDLMVMPGLINLDFADIRAVMSEMGKAMMGTGEASGERRALEAAEAAISNPLLDDVSMKGARGVLINITGGLDMTLFEVDEAANRIRSEVDQEAFIIFGSTFDQSMDGKVRVSVVATGMDTVAAAKPAQPKLSVVHTWDGRQGTGQAAGLRTREAAAAAVFAVSHSDADAQGTLDAAVAALAPERTELRAAAGGETAQGSGGADDGDAQSRNIFIPPAPVLKTAGDGRKGNGAGAAGTAKPADADSGGGFAKMSNLFHRVTGSLSGKGGRADSDGAAAEDHQDTAGKASPRFGSVNPEERLPASRSEDELLDIPAFLRRQAN